MPVFYFDIIVDGQRSPDAFGLDLSDVDEAREQAAALLPDVARDELPGGQCRDFACEVRDWSMRPIYTCTLTFRGQGMS